MNSHQQREPGAAAAEVEVKANKGNASISELNNRRLIEIIHDRRLAKAEKIKELDQIIEEIIEEELDRTQLVEQEVRNTLKIYCRMKLVEFDVKQQNVVLLNSLVDNLKDNERLIKEIITMGVFKDTENDEPLKARREIIIQHILNDLLSFILYYRLQTWVDKIRQEGLLETIDLLAADVENEVDDDLVIEMINNILANHAEISKMNVNAINILEKLIFSDFNKRRIHADIAYHIKLQNQESATVDEVKADNGNGVGSDLKDEEVNVQLWIARLRNEKLLEEIDLLAADVGKNVELDFLRDWIRGILESHDKISTFSEHAKIELMKFVLSDFKNRRIDAALAELKKLESEEKVTVITTPKNASLEEAAVVIFKMNDFVVENEITKDSRILKITRDNKTYSWEESYVSLTLFSQTGYRGLKVNVQCIEQVGSETRKLNVNSIDDFTDIFNQLPGVLQTVLNVRNKKLNRGIQKSTPPLGERINNQQASIPDTGGAARLQPQ